uniref:Janus kinase and microtubule interacting protein 2 n=1 Tax=Sinocyclocheilus grahami TaxID=75366 RepID=A0A672JTZ7_SINGR
MAKKGRAKGEKPEALISALQAANEDLRSKLTDIQIELHQEKCKVTKLEREKVQEGKRIREQEQHRHTVMLTEQRARWHEEKLKELAALRESLTRQHEQELARTAKIKEGEIQRLRTALSALRDGSGEKVRTALTLEAREEARRFFDHERVKLLQEIVELKSSKRQKDEALNTIILADKMKAGDLRSEHQAHQEQISKIKWDSERDVRRLVDEIKAKDRTIFALEKELETATGFVQKLMLQKDVLDEQLFLVKEAECNLGSPKREIPGRAGDGAEHCGSPDMRRNQKRMSELKATIRKLEDRNSILVDERNELLKRVRETEKQCKPLLEKNKLLSKKNDELSHSLQRTEDKLKSITKENLEMKEKITSHPPLKKLKSLNDLDQASDDQEIEFLKLQVLEQQSMIDELTRDREKLLRKKRHKRSRPIKRHIVVDTFYGYDEESMDSETSSVASLRMDRTPATPDEDLDEGLAAEESELRFKQLTREYQALQRAYALLQEQKGGVLDAEMEAKAHEQLQADVQRYKAKIEDLENELALKGQVKQHLCNIIRIFSQMTFFLMFLRQVEKSENENGKLQQELQDSKDQNELLEFRILELEEKRKRAFASDVKGISQYNKVIFPVLDVRSLNYYADVICEMQCKTDALIIIIYDMTVDLQEMFCKQKGYLEEELDYRKQALDQAYMQIQELEATLYNALQQDKVIKYGEPLDELQKDELRAAVEKLRRQMLRKSREYDCQVLQERMELLHQAHQRIRDLEDKTDIQRRQIKDLEEKVRLIYSISGASPIFCSDMDSSGCNDSRCISGCFVLVV